MPRILITIFVLFLSLGTLAGQSDTLYKPNIEGSIRAKYEYNTNENEHRFQVRNARFSVNGKLSSITSYKAEIDLSDEGVTRMLDAYIRIQPLEWLRFTIGQQKIPFSTDNIRSPHQLYFANRSFIGKQLTGLRDVGFTIDFINSKSIPFDFSAGIYNGTGLYNQKTWRKPDEMSYVARLKVKPLSNMELFANVNSICPTDLRMNLFNAGAWVEFYKLHLETEVFYKTYQDDTYNPTQGFFAFASYNIFTKGTRLLRKISPVFRYDMMTDNVRFDDSGNIKSDVARSRITGGLTFSLNKPFLNDIRLNYEQYFYAPGIENSDNKFVVEFVVKF